MELTLDEPLEYEHLGVDETFGTHTVEFRGKYFNKYLFNWSRDTLTELDIFSRGRFAVAQHRGARIERPRMARRHSGVRRRFRYGGICHPNLLPGKTTCCG